MPALFPQHINELLVIRLTESIDQQKTEKLKASFSDILRPGGGICLSEPLPQEIDEPELSRLPRLLVDFKRQDFGRLKELIDAINSD